MKMTWEELVERGLRVNPQSKHASSSVRAFLARKGLLDEEVEVVFPDGSIHRYRPAGVRGGMPRKTQQQRQQPQRSFNVGTKWGVITVTPSVEIDVDTTGFAEARASLERMGVTINPQLEAQLRRAFTQVHPIWILKVRDRAALEVLGIRIPDEPGPEKQTG